METLNHDAIASRLEEEAEKTAQQLGSETVPKDWTVLGMFALVAGILFLAICYFYIIGQGELPSDSFVAETKVKDRFELRGLFGDQWGAFTGVMSGLSLAFVALSLLAQRSELRMSRRELSMQRLELKYARAQSHRQIAELQKQREEEEQRGKFQKEPIVMLKAVRLVPVENGAEIHMSLEHNGPAACELLIEANFSEEQSYFIKAPQIVFSSHEVVHKLVASDVSKLMESVPDKGPLSLELNLSYRNLAGGSFTCHQSFELSKYYLKNFRKEPYKENGVNFEVIDTTLKQSERSF